MEKESKDKLRIALIQFDYDPLEIDRILKYISWAENSDIICFPEAFAAGRTIEKTSQYLKNVLGKKNEILKNVCDATDSCVVLPLVDRVKEGRLYNTSYIIKNRRVIGKYNKIHVFPWGEFFFDCGEEHHVFDIGKCTMGVMICYDSAFPETSRVLALKGASIIIISASWPEEAAYLWKARLTARAMDNQIFIAGVNRCGSIGNENFTGGSIVINPRGEIVAMCGNAEQILVVNIDLNLIKTERDQEPVWQSFDRTLYEHILNKRPPSKPAVSKAT